MSQLRDNGTARVADAGRGPQDEVVLRADRISKRFPGAWALRGVNFDLRAGEVHALVGENGAGKSTLAKIISGAQPPDEGRLEICGSDCTGRGPREHARAGVQMVYQEPSVVPQLSATDNVFLGSPPVPGPFLRRRVRLRRFRKLAVELGIEIPARAPAGSLGVAQQRLVDILRALHANCRVLIMDEPTASLGPVEREALYGAIGRLTGAGVAVIYISHDLDEVLALSDRVSVMREGLLVDSRTRDQWDPARLVRAMLGREMEISVREKTDPSERVALKVDGLSVPGKLRDISFDLHGGEILGVAGLMGSGSSTLLRSIAGAEASARGAMEVDGAAVRWPRSVRAAIRQGIVLSPENRKTEGLIAGMSGEANVSLSNPSTVTAGPFLSHSRMRQRATALAAPLGFDPARLGAPAGTLSGGNQQKLVVAKCLNRGPRILLLDEPTTGIDVGAKAELFGAVAALAAEGISVIVTSSEFEEVVANSHRVLVLSAGRVSGVLSGEQQTVERVLELAFRLSPDPDESEPEGGRA